VDDESFRNAHAAEHAKCFLPVRAYIRRQIYLSRSY